MTFALMVLAGSVGALSRYELGGLVYRLMGAARPWGTAAVNISGALALGLFFGLVASQGLAAWAAALGIGFFGGYTTFSTWMVESLYIAKEGRRGFGALLLNLAGMLLAGTAALIAGLSLGGWR